MVNIEKVRMKKTLLLFFTEEYKLLNVERII